MADARMQIKIDGNADGAINATNQAERAINTLSGTLKGLAIGGGILVAAKKGFELFSDAVKKTADFLGSCIDEAANAELQFVKLNQALESTGNYSKATSDELNNYATALSKVTAYEDDSIVSVEAMLATFKLNKEEIKIATQATLDLAAATGQDLQSAAILMGKAMVGETGTLSRYGIIVDENKLKTQGWRAVIDEISTEFGGQAAAQADTYSGKLAQMKNEFGNVKETIGGAIIPILGELFDSLTKGPEVINPMTGEVAKLNSPLQNFAELVKKAADGIKTFFEQHWDEIKEKITGVYDAISTFISQLQNADWTGFTAAVNDFKSAILELVGENGIGKVEVTGQGFVDAITKMAEGTVIATMSVQILRDAFLLLGNDLAWVLSLYEAQAYFLMGDFKMGMTVFHEANKKVAESADTLTGDIDELQLKVKEFKDRSDEATESTKQLKAGIDNLPSYKTITITTEYKSIYGAIQEQKADIETLNRQSGGVMASSGLLAKDMQWVTDLEIPVKKGEAILPSYVVKAIQQNRSSFAGLDTSQDGSITNNFNISEIVIREESDINRIAQELYNMQKTALRGAGAR